MNKLSRLLPDSFTLAILAVVVLALVLPCSGESAHLVGIGSEIAIVLLFFLQGARLSRPAVLAGILHWRLHLIIFAATFVVFPLLGLALSPLSGTVLTPPLYVGLVFLCTLPSSVQASVVFTSMAGGNVPAALCSASISSVIGMVLTPLLVGLLLQAHGGAPLNGVGSIALHLLLPFLAGQVLQSRIDAWMQRHGQAVRLVDRESVLLMIYGMFSVATLSGMVVYLGTAIALRAKEPRRRRTVLGKDRRHTLRRDGGAVAGQEVRDAWSAGYSSRGTADAALPLQGARSRAAPAGTGTRSSSSSHSPRSR